MKKREVYEGWRFPHETKLLTKEGNIWTIKDTFHEEYKTYFPNWMFIKRNKISASCPCGKGCKPIRCRIIVENEV